MSHRPKPSKHKRLRLGHSKRHAIRLPLFVLLFAAIGIIVIALSSAAPPGGGSPTPPVAPNPTVVSTACRGGINIALLADVSTSINGSEFSDMQTAFKSFVSSLLPGTPTQFSITQFSDNATELQGLSSNTNSLNNAIDNLSSGGRTNWTAGLQTAYGTISGLSSSAPRLLIIATDGDPNVPTGAGTALNDAITEANTIKSAGVHILAIGLGSDPTLQNLEDISGPKVNTGDDNSDVITADFSTLESALISLAEGTCGGNGGGGTGGSGTGTGGTGTGSGKGGTGTGTGGPSPTPSKTKAKTPTKSTQPNPAPTASVVGPQPNPAPQPKAQGTQTKPPKPQPSPFYDGKQYTPGSAPDKLAVTSSHHGIPSWLYVLLATIIALALVSFPLWLSRYKTASKATSKKKTSKSKK